jgi:hypothetical protein
MIQRVSGFQQKVSHFAKNLFLTAGRRIRLKNSSARVSTTNSSPPGVTIICGFGSVLIADTSSSTGGRRKSQES